jgi:small-conductance mechanosensitive channel
MTQINSWAELVWHKLTKEQKENVIKKFGSRFFSILAPTIALLRWRCYGIVFIITAIQFVIGFVIGFKFWPISEDWSNIIWFLISIIVRIIVFNNIREWAFNNSSRKEYLVSESTNEVNSEPVNTFIKNRNYILYITLGVIILLSFFAALYLLWK